MKLRLTTTNDLTAVMTIINQAKVYLKSRESTNGKMVILMN